MDSGPDLSARFSSNPERSSPAWDFLSDFKRPEYEPEEYWSSRGFLSNLMGVEILGAAPEHVYSRYLLEVRVVSIDPSLSLLEGGCSYYGVGDR